MSVLQLIVVSEQALVSRNSPQLYQDTLSNNQFPSDSSTRHQCKPTVKQTNLHLTFWNVRSLCNKATEVGDYITEQNIDLLAITETWLKDTDSHVISECTPTGYSICHTPRITSSGGGVALVYKSSMKLSSWKPLHFNSFEATLATLLYHGISIKLVILYRPPPNKKNRSTTQQFLSEFGNLLEQFSSCDSHLFIVGDFNLHIDNPQNTDTKKFTLAIDSCGLKQWVQSSTHIHGHILDLLITNSDSVVDSISISPPTLSDHSPVHAKLKLQKPTHQKRQVTYRSISSIDTKVFSSDIFTISEFHQPPSDVHSAIATYNTHLSSLLDQHAPLKKRIETIRPNSKWYTTEIRQAKQQRRSAERKWRTSKLEVHLQIFKDKCRNVNTLIRQAKCNYYTNLIKENANNQKTLFRAVSTLFNKPTSLPTNTSIPDLTQQFSQYFVKKITDIRHNLNSSASTRQYSNYEIQSKCNLSQFKPIQEEDLKKIIINSPTKSCCLDPIPTSLLKKCIDPLLPFITETVNLSLLTGTVPQLFKSAVITPLLKKPSLDFNILKNYRPVSNLPFLSKVLERIIAAQITDYLKENSLQPLLQSAYRKFHSTETALLKVHNDICLSVDSGNYVLLILLDLSAAFDTIDHKILLQRLSHLGISDVVLKWFTSYLMQRDQCVKINNNISDNIELSFGVPQGSVLGPLLFTLYIAPLGNLIHKHGLNFHQYADDNQLYLSFARRDSPTALSSIETCIQDIKEWMTLNKLQLNDSKTEVLLIRSKFNCAPAPLNSVNIGSTSIVPVTSARNIGMVFDNTHMFSQHIKYTCKSIYSHLRKIGSIRRYLTNKACQTLIHATLTAKLDYCNSLLYGLPDNTINLLQRAQNTAARIITRTRKFAPITPVLTHLHWLPVRHRIDYKILLLTFKAMHNQTPTYISDLIQPYRPTRELRSSTKKLLTSTTYKTINYGGRSFSYAAPRLWNALPLDIRESTNLETFKRKLKTHLFSKAYSVV